MRRFIGIGCFFALACTALTFAGGPAGASSSAPKLVPGATYAGTGTKLVVDASGTEVHVLALPVHAKCKGEAPSNEGDYGSSGLGPFGIGKDGTFSNLEPGEKAGPTQAVIRGKFSGDTAQGTVVEPAFTDKGFDCARFTGAWKAARVKGTGDTTKPGSTYATDDFSTPSSGFAVYNDEASYAEYLGDQRFRIGTRQPTAATSLREAPVTPAADITVTTGFTSGSGGDGAGVACLGTDPRSFIAGYVTLDGKAGLIRYANGAIAEQADDATLPPGLLKTGPQAQNEVRLICKPSTDAQHTNLYLYLNGTQVSNAEASVGGAGKVGVLVGSSSGATEFTFSKFAVRKPKS